MRSAAGNGWQTARGKAVRGPERRPAPIWRQEAQQEAISGHTGDPGEDDQFK